MRRACLLLALTLLAPTRSPAQIVATRIASGLNFPVFATHAPGDTQRLFVVEVAGAIRVIRNDSLLTRPFLDISSIVKSGGEQGCLGLAFHPDYAQNGYFYVYFIQDDGTSTGLSTILRYTVSSDPDSAVAGSGVPVFQLAQPYANHNGGTILFGSDGYLWLGLGDGGGSGDPADRAQNGLELFGKLLRLDVDGGDAYPADPNNNYAIPADNPFVGNPSFRDEIWALGLRNPYRWSFDRATGDLWIGDVGQDCYEEVDVTPAGSGGGENYGWDVMEGPHCYDDLPPDCSRGPCGSGFVDPIHWIAHPAGLIALTGGYVYRGKIAAIQGEYFFAEYFSADIFSIRWNGTAVTDTTDWTATLAPSNTTIDQIASFGEDANGELYIVDAGGEIFRIEADPAVDVPAIAKPGPLTLGPVHPNPFSGTTRFDVSLTRAADLTVSVYSADGRLVARIHQGETPAGTLPLEWRVREGVGTGVSAGVYFVRAEAEGQVRSARVVLLR